MPFRIENHRLVDVPFRASPFADERPCDCEPELIVVHGISLPPGEFGGPHVDELFMGGLNPAGHPYFAEIQGLEVSAHLFVRRGGEVIQYVPFDRRAWHAGISHWRGRQRCNDFSIGIELEGTDESAYAAEQYAALAEVVAALRAAYPRIDPDALAGHCDIAPGRKTDPGPAFDWALFSELLDAAQRQV